MNVGSILVGGLDLTQGAMEEEDFKPGSCDKSVVSRAHAQFLMDQGRKAPKRGWSQWRWSSAALQESKSRQGHHHKSGQEMRTLHSSCRTHVRHTGIPSKLAGCQISPPPPTSRLNKNSSR